MSDQDIQSTIRCKVLDLREIKPKTVSGVLGRKLILMGLWLLQIEKKQPIMHFDIHVEATQAGKLMEEFSALKTDELIADVRQSVIKGAKAFIRLVPVVNNHLHTDAVISKGDDADLESARKLIMSVANKGKGVPRGKK